MTASFLQMFAAKEEAEFKGTKFLVKVYLQETLYILIPPFFFDVIYFHSSISAFFSRCCQPMAATPPLAGSVKGQWSSLKPMD
jgi:hypothetical protein